MVEVVGDDIFLKEQSIKDRKRRSMAIPANDLVGKAIRYNFPDRFNELGYPIFPHFFDYLSKFIYSKKPTYSIRIISEPLNIPTPFFSLFYSLSSTLPPSKPSILQKDGGNVDKE